MTGTLRRGLLRVVAVAVVVNVTFFIGAFIGLGSDVWPRQEQNVVDALGLFMLGVGQPLASFFGATVLDLGWWASFGALLAAFLVAHRRRISPEA